MQLILVRHGIAVDPAKYAANGGAEPERPLTERGIKRTKRAARGLRRVVDGIDLIATSPYRRAVQTAEVLGQVFSKTGKPKTVTVSALSPGGVPGIVAEWLQQQEQQSTIVLVGHEPDMSQLFAFLTIGNAVNMVRFGKAGAAMLRCPGGPVGGSCELVWYLPPSILRRLGV